MQMLHYNLLCSSGKFQHNHKYNRDMLTSGLILLLQITKSLCIPLEGNDSDMSCAHVVVAGQPYTYLCLLGHTL